MGTLVDDVGSFPLPAHISRELFDKAYVRARETIILGNAPEKDEFLLDNFHKIVLDSFKKKLATGLGIANYPQHYDMHRQFGDIISKAMENGTYVVDQKHASIPEVHVINKEAKTLYEETGEKILLRLCITGPMELYLKLVGTIGYEDVLMMFAETVQRFAKNSILDSKFIKTVVVSLDEPSFGFQDIIADRETLADVWNKAFDFTGTIRQIHLHSPSKITDILTVKNIDVLSFEFGASPRSIEGFSTKMLDEADKQVRVGIARTDIDAINAELHDGGIAKPSTEQLVESEETMQKRFAIAKEKFGERMTFTGPDCGLGGWPSQEAALLLLKRTVNAVKKARSY